jgi:hypothetical protein
MDKPFLGETYVCMDTMVEKTVEIITQEAPILPFIDVDCVEHVKSIIVMRWNGFNTPLHILVHILNPRFYDEDSIAQSNGKRTAPHKDKEVASGVKKSFQRLFPFSQQIYVREEFVEKLMHVDKFKKFIAYNQHTNTSTYMRIIESETITERTQV